MTWCVSTELVRKYHFERTRNRGRFKDAHLHFILAEIMSLPELIAHSLQTCHSVTC